MSTLDSIEQSKSKHILTLNTCACFADTGLFLLIRAYIALLMSVLQMLSVNTPQCYVQSKV